MLPHFQTDALPGFATEFQAKENILQLTFVIIEHFRNGDAVPVYRRFRERGRMAPEGLSYVASWVTPDLTRCYQVMETHDRALLEQWIANWSDLVECEIHPVITSAEAVERIAPRLENEGPSWKQ